MPFPTGWPAPFPTGRRSIRFLRTGTATANYSDNAFLFIDDAGANPFTPTPYVEPGDELKSIQTVKLPLGTGRDPRDAYFHPKEFQRGTGGTGNAFTKSGSTMTFTSFTASPKFDQDLVGKEIRVTGSTSGGNNGTFTITSVVNDYTITWENSAGVAEAFPSGGAYRIRRIVVAPPKAYIWSGNILVRNTGGADLTISFDGTTDHGIIGSAATVIYRERYEAGIALKGSGTFQVEAW